MAPILRCSWAGPRVIVLADFGYPQFTVERRGAISRGYEKDLKKSHVGIRNRPFISHPFMRRANAFCNATILLKNAAANDRLRLAETETIPRFTLKYFHF